MSIHPFPGSVLKPAPQTREASWLVAEEDVQQDQNGPNGTTVTRKELFCKTSEDNDHSNGSSKRKPFSDLTNTSFQSPPKKTKASTGKKDPVTSPAPQSPLTVQILPDELLQDLTSLLTPTKGSPFFAAIPHTSSSPPHVKVFPALDVATGTKADHSMSVAPSTLGYISPPRKISRNKAVLLYDVKNTSPPPAEHPDTLSFCDLQTTWCAMEAEDTDVAHEIVDILRSFPSNMSADSVDNFSSKFVANVRLPEATTTAKEYYQSSVDIIFKTPNLASSPLHHALTGPKFVSFVDALDTCSEEYFERFCTKANAVKVHPDLCPWTEEFYFSPGGRAVSWKDKKQRAQAEKLVQLFRTILIMLRCKQLYPDDSMVTKEHFEQILTDVVAALVQLGNDKDYDTAKAENAELLHRMYNSFVIAKKLQVPKGNKTLLLSCAEYLLLDGTRLTYGSAESPCADIIKALYEVDHPEVRRNSEPTTKKKAQSKTNKVKK